MFKLYKLLLVSALLFAAPKIILGQVTANFTANITTGCDPMVVQFTNLSTNSTSWLWDFGNGVTSTLKDPSTTYTSTGSYTVKLTASNGSASNTKTITGYINVYSPPTVNFAGSPLAGCPSLAVQFTSTSTLNSPGNGTYVWNFGTGQTVTTQNPTYTFTAPGLYTVTHVVVNGAGCTTSVVKNNYVEVFTPPVVNFSGPTIVCGPTGSATFTSNIVGTGPYTYQWTFGDGNSSTAANPTHTYANPGTYTVMLVVTDANGCMETVQKSNYVTVTSGTNSFTISPQPVCAGTMITFMNTTPFTVSRIWNFGDGTPTDNNNVAFHAYQNPGTYICTLSVNNGNCITNSYQTIVIHPNPTVNFVSTPPIPCPAPTTIQFTNQTVNGTTYNWDFGDGTTSTQVSPAHTYNANGSYNVTLIGSNGFGCSSTIIKPLHVDIKPMYLTINAKPGSGCIPVVDSFWAILSADTPNLVTYPAPITSYFWSFGDGGTSTQPTPKHTYPNYGTYNVKLVITTANGCADSANFLVRAGTPPTANFTASPTVICVNQTVLFQNLSTNALSYVWYYGDGGKDSNVVNPAHFYSYPGTYTVKLIAINNGCIDTIQKINYIVVNDPKAIFTTNYFCDTLTKVKFNNSSINATSYMWYFGDGATSTAASPTHIYPTMNNYMAMLVAHNSTTGCYDTVRSPITFFDPKPSFVANDTAICPGDYVTFTSSVIGNQYVRRYDWIFGNQILFDTTANIVKQYTTPGYHTVSFIIEDQHNCRDTFTRTNYILVGQPLANFTTNNVNVCAPATVSFNNTSTVVPGTFITNMSWDFGNGQTATGTSSPVTTTYTAAGSYNVSLSVVDNIGCTDFALKNAYINVYDPKADFSVNNTNGCLGTPMLFISQSSGTALTYFWDFGDGTTSTSGTPNKVYSQTGTYTVKLVITDAFGCKDSMTKTNFITVWVRPVASFSLNDTFKICPPLLVSATNLSTGASLYSWSMGDGSTNNTVNPTHIYFNPGQYNIRLVATNIYGCRDTAYQSVKLLGYNGAFSYTPLTGCNPLTVTFKSNVQNVPGFVWDFRDGTTLATTDSVVTYTYTKPGAYIPRLIMTDNMGCSATSYGLDTIKVDGVYAGYTYTPYPACDFGTLNFLDTSKGAFSTITSRLWEFHDGQISTVINPSKFFPAPGNYVIKLYTQTNSGCRDTLIDTLRFHPLPVIDAGPDTVICVGDSARFFPSGGVSYLWSPGTSLSCTNCTNPYASPSVPTVYTVIGTDIYGCMNTDIISVNLKTHTVIDVGEGGEFCETESFQLLATGAQSYIWSPNTGLNFHNIPDPIATPPASITYMVVGRDGSCVPDTGFVQLVVHPKPVIDAGPDQTIVAGEVALINSTGKYVRKYVWTPSETLNCSNCPDPEATPKQTTTYKVVVYTDFGCRDSDKVNIIVVCRESQVYMPNSFTPNNDGQNDVFYPRGKGLEKIRSFRIYNRWGELIFERRDFQENDRSNGWDGTYKGQLLNPDVFIYIIDAICDTGEPVSWKGDISLIR